MEDSVKEYDDLKTVKEVLQEKREKAKQALPVRKSAQKEFLRDFLSRHQDKFEDCMNQLAEYDPKTYVNIYKDLMKHIIPKQSEVSVTHGLDKDFQDLVALGMTKVDDAKGLEIQHSNIIHDADFVELKDFADGTSY